MAATRRARAGPGSSTTRHGWMLEFDGARMASSSASSTSARGSALLGRNMRVERRSEMACSRSNIDATSASGLGCAAYATMVPRKCEQGR
jgi:hypothetical protein